MIYETAPIGLAVLTTDCRYLLINQRLAEICGISIEGHIGRSVRETVPQVAEQVEQIVQNILRTGEPMVGIEVNGQRPDRSNADRFWTTHWHPLKDPEGRVVRINVVAEEVTERKRAQAALASSEARFQELADNMSQFAWTADATGSRTWFNRRWYEYTGTTFEDVQGWGWQSLHHPDHMNRAINRMREGYKSGVPWEDTFPLRGRDGKYRWFLTRVVPIRDQAGDIVRWFGTNTDITQQIEAEQALRNLNKTLAEGVETQARERDRIWNVSQDLLVVADMEGRIVSINPAWTATLGWTEDEMIEGTTERLIHPNDRDRTYAELAKLVAGHKTRRFDNRLQRKDGTYCWLSWRAVPDHDLIYAVARDITELKRAAEQLRQSRRELALVTSQTTMGAMTASIAHEVGQPLAAIVTNANAGLRWLAREEPDLAEVRAVLEKIANDGRRTTEMISGIRAMFRAGRGDTRPVDVGALIGEVLDVVHGDLESHQISVCKEIPGNLPRVTAERVQLQQVLYNLIMNAVDAMSSIADRNRELIISAEIHGGDNLKMMIADSGCGIDADHMPRIFEPFFTTKPHGLGMGLSICRSIIEAHGGRLWAVPQQPHGTAFYIQLAVSAEPKSNDVSSSSVMSAVQE
jgi:PAS domain S-box-containing protein